MCIMGNSLLNWKFEIIAPLLIAAVKVKKLRAALVALFVAGAAVVVDVDRTI